MKCEICKKDTEFKNLELWGGIEKTKGLDLICKDCLKKEMIKRERKNKKLFMNYKKQRWWKMKTFIVQAKDLFDEKKNPGLVLSPEKILENEKIPKTILK